VKGTEPWRHGPRGSVKCHDNSEGGGIVYHRASLIEKDLQRVMEKMHASGVDLRWKRVM